MTLKEKLLESLEQERKAIAAAIFLIKNSWSLDAIPLADDVDAVPKELVAATPPQEEGTRQKRPYTRRSARSSSTPPQPTRRTIDCPKCGRKKRDTESGKAFGAHKRHCSGNSSVSPKSSPTTKRPAPKPPLDDDDPDFGPDEDIPNPFGRTPAKPQGRPVELPPVRCETCNESFPDAKSLGIHKTRVHFGR